MKITTFLALSAVAAAGCGISKDQYAAKELEASQAQKKLQEESGKAAALDAKVADLEAKLAGLQSPRGWGLFIIKNMVDEMHITSDDVHHTVEIIMYRKGEGHGKAAI